MAVFVVIDRSRRRSQPVHLYLYLPMYVPKLCVLVWHEFNGPRRHVCSTLKSLQDVSCQVHNSLSRLSFTMCQNMKFCFIQKEVVPLLKQFSSRRRKGILISCQFFDAQIRIGDFF